MWRTLAQTGLVAAVLFVEPVTLNAKTTSSEDKQWPPKTYTENAPIITKLKTPLTQVSIENAVANLSNENDHLVEEAAYVFEQLGEQAVPILVHELRNRKEEDKLRINAIYMLGRMGEKSKNAVFLVSTFLRSGDASTRAVAAVALGKMGPRAQYAVPMLEKLQQDEDKWVRESAAKAIAKINLHASREHQIAKNLAAN